MRIDKLAIKGNIADVVAWKGPVPVFATLACGTGLSARLRREAQGWAFEEAKTTMC